MDCGKISEDILNALRQGGADMGECVVSAGETTEIYYESGKISMVRTVLNQKAAVKSIKEQKKGTFATNALTENTASEAAAAALAASEQAPADPAEGVAEYTENRIFARGSRTPDRDRLYTLLRDFLDTVARDYPKISFDSVSIGHSYGEMTYRNTNGVEMRESDGYNTFSTMFMAREGEKTSSFNYFGFVFNDLDTPLLERGMARTLLAETEQQIAPQPIEGKFEGDLIITPACLMDFLETAAGNFLSDGAMIEGTSIWKDSLNRPVASELLTWRSMPESPDLVATDRVSGDGYAAKNMTILEKGILKNFCLSRYGAAKTGRERSANTQSCYVVDPGETTLAEMIASISNGLLLNRISGGAPASNGDVSAVAKNSFLIRDGKIAGAVTETMLSGNIAAMLKQITAISKERISDGASILPWIKTTGVTISGK